LRRLSYSLAALALLAIPSLATGQRVTASKIVNLDGDPALEQVIPQEVCTSLSSRVHAAACTPEQYSQRRIVIEDTCNTTPRAVVVSSVQDIVNRLSIVNLDGLTPRPEIYFDLRSGASGRVGDTRIIRWDDPAAAGTCEHIRTLFKYPSRRARGKIPRGASYRDNYGVRVKEFSKRYPGQEVRLTETYVKRHDAFCCPSFERTSYFGYSGGKDAYERYSTRVKRIKK
jgi:hypothetical protein